MTDTDYRRPKPEEPQQLNCKVCMKEIPTSVAHTLEGPDYVLHFCGLDCLEHWREKGEKEESEQSPDKP